MDLNQVKLYRGRYQNHYSAARNFDCTEIQYHGNSKFKV